MRILSRMLKLGRPRLRSLVIVALLTSGAAAAGLLEPWLYRAIINDVAGVFVAEDDDVEEGLQLVARATQHLTDSASRIFAAPLRPFIPPPSGDARALESRTSSEAIATLLAAAVLMVLSRLLAEAMKMVGDNRAAVTANAIERDFIQRVFSHVLRLPIGFFSGRGSGAVARRIDQSDQITPIFTALSQEILPHAVMLVASLWIMAAVNWQLALIVLAAAPVYGLVTYRLSRAIDHGLEDYYLLWDEVSIRIRRAISGIRTVRAYGAERAEEARLRDAIDRSYSTHLTRSRVQNHFTYLQDVVITMSKAGIVVFGGMKALDHQLTPGDVVLFLAYLDHVYQPIEQLTGVYLSLQQHAMSYRRAERLLETEVEHGAQRPSLSPGPGAVIFTKVRFGYAGDAVLKDVSFEIPAGQRVALVGPSGAGKTTVTDLLCALYQADGGDIQVDGQSLREVSPESVRQAIRGVGVDSAVFAGTIRNNIVYGRPDATESELEAALAACGLGSHGGRWRQGLDTEVEDRGVNLSAGERQRLLLARAIVSKPRVLILDEATANLDFSSEEAVRAAVRALGPQITTIIIAHRPAMVADVDRVLVLREGRIEEDGSPDDLVRRGGYFSQMMAKAAA